MGTDKFILSQITQITLLWKTRDSLSNPIA